MDLKICLPSRCLLLCEAVQAAKPDGEVTEPVKTQTSLVRATVDRELPWKTKNMKLQKQKKSESMKREREEKSQNSDHWVQRHNWMGPLKKT